MSANNWRIPESDLMAAVGETAENDRPAVLATIIHVEGSAYRRPGAKMLITEEGKGLGSVTAGCLENELSKLADNVLEEETSRIETFDLTGDDDVWGLGVGCNGVIDILLEPLGREYSPVVDAFETGEPIAVVSVLDNSGSVSGRMHCRDGGDPKMVSGDVPDSLADRIAPTLETALARGRSERVGVEVEGEEIDVFVDGISPPPKLTVLGHGHDVGPVVELAKKNDFRVSVVTFRGGEKAVNRFPAADEIRSTSPVRLAEDVPLDEDTFVVIMSHNFVDDRLSLETLLDTDVPYIGLLGPHERFTEMVSEFETEGLRLSREDLERIYTPIGLNLGGGTPYQIAHSIIAEILAVRNGRQIVHLRDREGPIHDRLSLDAESR